MSFDGPAVTPPAFVRQLEERVDALESKVNNIDSLRSADTMALTHLVGGIAHELRALIKHFNVKVEPIK